VTPKTNHLIFSVYLALEEVNKNCHILPNISLLVNIECNGRKYDEKTGLALKIENIIPNYSCTNERTYLIVLTAPIWAVSTKLGPFLFMSRIPEVSQDGIILRKYFLTSVRLSDYEGSLKGRGRCNVHYDLSNLYLWIDMFCGKHNNFIINGDGGYLYCEMLYQKTQYTFII
jgi:hypothetical protein